MQRQVWVGAETGVGADVDTSGCRCGWRCRCGYRQEAWVKRQVWIQTGGLGRDAGVDTDRRLG